MIYDLLLIYNKSRLRNMSGRIIIILLILFTASCRSADRVRENPLVDGITDLIYRKSCISVDIPPITITPGRTAAERQLIGEDRELEPDGWLIASSVSARRAEDILSTADTEELRRLHRELGILEFYRAPVEELKGAGIIGESHDGRLLIVPPNVNRRTGRYRRQEEINRASNIMNEVNYSRRWIMQFFLRIENETDNPDPDSILRRYQKSYMENALPGEWVFTEERRWVQVQ